MTRIKKENETKYILIKVIQTCICICRHIFASSFNKMTNKISSCLNFNDLFFMYTRWFFSLIFLGFEKKISNKKIKSHLF